MVLLPWAQRSRHRSLVDPPMSSFLSSFPFFVFVCAVAPASVVLRLYRWLCDGCSFIYKAGQKHVSIEIIFHLFSPFSLFLRLCSCRSWLWPTAMDFGLERVGNERDS